jgi:aryl-alcohol dehydrogenase-like predicted oxidoreductase
MATMQHCSLGHSGLKVSRLCLGTMMFGVQTDQETTRRIVASAREAGVNFIDTSSSYGLGRSEEVVGQVLKGDRNHWILATKVGNPLPHADLSRRYVMRSIDESLRRLGTDHVDLYYLHRDDPTTPLEETVRTMADLVRAGKIRHIGVSNFSAWRMAQLIRLCDEAGIDRPAASQPLYNAVNRMAEAEHIPACRFFGLGVVPYSPLARGILSGKYPSLDQIPEGSRAARNDHRMMVAELRPESIACAQEIQAHAQAGGRTAAHFAVQWVLNNALVTSVIAGPRTLEQWDEYLAAMASPFTAQDEALVDRLVAPGHPSTPGYTDPQFPITGRVARTAAR